MPKKPRRPPTTPTTVSPPSIPNILLDGGPLPSLFVFDLDYTLWPFWVDTHVTPPLKPTTTTTTNKYNLVHDRHGDSWSFYPDVPHILSTLRNLGVSIAAASRTHTPELAREMLSFLAPDPSHTAGIKTRGIDLFDWMEIYPGSKTTHFRKLKDKTGVGFAEMVFFDDEERNRNVERELGVKMVGVKTGVDWSVIERGVEEWRVWRKKNCGGKGG